MPSLPSVALPDTTFGAALIGVLVAAFLCGVMMIQTHIYFHSNRVRTDVMLIKLLVILLLILDFAQLAFEVHFVYDALVSNWGNPLWFFSKPVWSANLVPLFTNVIAALAQMGYARKIYILSDRGLVKTNKLVKCAIPFAITILAFATLIFGLVIFIELETLTSIAEFGSIFWKIYTATACVVAADILIVASLSYYLLKGRTGFKETDALIDKLVYVIINTGLLPSLFTIADVASLVISKGSFVHLAFNFIAAKLYANSWMALLNARTLLGFNPKASASIRLSTVVTQADEDSLVFRNPPQTRVRNDISLSSSLASELPSRERKRLERRHSFDNLSYRDWSRTV